MLNKLIKMRNKKGFTLIELIVVLVIMAIIAAMAVPAMMGYVNEAKKSTHLANCRAVYVAGQADITTQLAKSDTVATTNMAANIVKLVPDLNGKTINFITDTAKVPDNTTVANNGEYYVFIDLTAKKVTSVAYRFGTGDTKFVSLTPGAENGTNIIE